MHYSFRAVGRAIYNSNQLLDEDLRTSREGKKGSVVPDIESDKCTERENRDGDECRDTES